MRESGGMYQYQLMSLHFPQGVYHCDYCADRRAGVCRGRQLAGYKSCKSCIEAGHIKNGKGE